MIEDPETLARQNLLKEMRDICFILTRKTWLPDFDAKLYDVVEGVTEQIEGQRLAPPLLSHIDSLAEISENAGGWFTADDASAFVDFDAWDARYAAWRASQ